MPLLPHNNYEPETGVYDVEYYLSSLDPFRFARLGQFTVPYPIRQAQRSQKVENIVEAVRKKCLDILHQYNIKCDEIKYENIAIQWFYILEHTMIICTHDEGMRY